MTPRAQPPQARRPSVVVRYRHPGDPDTLQPGFPACEDPSVAVAAAPSTAGSPHALLAERTADLQRVKAEYDNYRHRAQREREQVHEDAVAELVASLLPVLDTIDAARSHADLAGFEAAAQELHERLGALGLHRFGAVGERFDPAQHEAVAAADSVSVDQPICAQLLRPGYRLGNRLLRAADVTVAQPPARTGTARETEHDRASSR
jgi:molecular chaperone GrpE